MLVDLGLIGTDATSGDFSRFCGSRHGVSSFKSTVFGLFLRVTVRGRLRSLVGFVSTVERGSFLTVVVHSSSKVRSMASLVKDEALG